MFYSDEIVDDMFVAIKKKIADQKASNSMAEMERTIVKKRNSLEFLHSMNQDRIKRLRRQVKQAEDDLQQARQKQNSKAAKTTGSHLLLEVMFCNFQSYQAAGEQA